MQDARRDLTYLARRRHRRRFRSTNWPHHRPHHGGLAWTTDVVNGDHCLGSSGTATIAGIPASPSCRRVFGRAGRHRFSSLVKRAIKYARAFGQQRTIAKMPSLAQRRRELGGSCWTRHRRPTKPIQGLHRHGGKLHLHLQISSARRVQSRAITRVEQINVARRSKSAPRNDFHWRPHAAESAARRRPSRPGGVRFGAAAADRTCHHSLSHSNTFTHVRIAALPHCPIAPPPLTLSLAQDCQRNAHESRRDRAATRRRASVVASASRSRRSESCSAGEALAGAATRGWRAAASRPARRRDRLPARRPAPPARADAAACRRGSVAQAAATPTFHCTRARRPHPRAVQQRRRRGRSWPPVSPIRRDQHHRRDGSPTSSAARPARHRSCIRDR